MEKRTQQFKAVSLREIVGNALQGRPINVNTTPLYDLEDTDIDSDDMIVDEFSDPLEVTAFFIERHEIKNDFLLAQEQEEKDKKTDKEPEKEKKGGMENETEKTPPVDA